MKYYLRIALLTVVGLSPAIVYHQTGDMGAAYFTMLAVYAGALVWWWTK